MTTGRLKDVVIEEHYYPDPLTELPRFGNATVYADPGMCEIIQKVKGVVDAFCDSPQDVMYSVFLDPRYDREWVKAEIEAAIRCAE